MQFTWKQWQPLALTWFQPACLLLLVLLSSSIFTACDQQAEQTDGGPRAVATSVPQETSAASPGQSYSTILQVTPPRLGSSMAYDAKTGSVVLFGGSTLNDTWTWNGHGWQQLMPATSPPARTDASMTYDATTGQTLLFGGITPQGSLLNDTWSWNGDNWVQLHPSLSPPAREQASLAYDESDQRIILFGGETAAGHISPPGNDTWSWDGHTWTQLQPATTPSARAGAAMAYDSAQHNLILFGGTSASSAPINDTWSWDGHNWIQLRPATSPSPRTRANLFYDSNLRQAVLFAGIGNTTFLELSDTWLWNGTTWTQHPTSQAPGGPYIVSAYNPAQHRAIAYTVSMKNKQINNSGTWLWDGSTWKISR